jgi:hypothetical protein
VKFARQLSQKILIVRQFQRLMGAHDDNPIISRRQIVLEQAKGFAKHALDPIPPRRRANAARDRQTKPAVLQSVRMSING